MYMYSTGRVLQKNVEAKLEEKKTPANKCKNIHKVKICIEQDPGNTSAKKMKKV